MSSLQVDSISSMGGGHVDGAGLVVQFKEAVNTTMVTVASGVTTTIATLNFTPKFADSLILCQAFHSDDECKDAASSHAYSSIRWGTNIINLSGAIGYKITKTVGSRFVYSHTGSIPSWGITPRAIDLNVQANNGTWTVSKNDDKTSLLVWEIAQ